MRHASANPLPIMRVVLGLPMRGIIDRVNQIEITQADERNINGEYYD